VPRTAPSTRGVCLPCPCSFAELFNAIKVEDFSSYISKVGGALAAGCRGQETGMCLNAGEGRVWVGAWPQRKEYMLLLRRPLAADAAAAFVNESEHRASAPMTALQLTTPRELMLFMTGERLRPAHMHATWTLTLPRPA